MKKQNIKEKFGKKNIIKRIKSALLKCIRLGRKRMWIKGVPSGGNMADGKDLRTRFWIRSIG